MDEEKLSHYEIRAQEAEKRLAELSERLNALQSGGNSGNSSKRTVLTFENPQLASSFVERKYWLCSPTWGGRVEGNRVFVKYYPPLSQQELQHLASSKEGVVPERLCRFDQYYSKQAQALESSLFKVSEEGEEEQLAPRNAVSAPSAPKREDASKPVSEAKEVLPIPGKRNVLITSALPYVNNVPHLGNIVGSVLSADVFARYCRLRGVNTVFVCGTDEYGTATETKAVQEGLTPQQICDKYNKIHAEVYNWFDIQFDKFGRTTTQQQTEIAQKIFLELYENGNIIEDSIEQLYCLKCQKFLADRFVEGTCPLCGYHDARGDQCDGCGHLLNAIELVNPQCKLDRTTPVIKPTTHLFLDLPKLNDRLAAWIEQASTKGEWSQNAVQITHAWLKEGLKPRCITRDLKWGTPVPLEKFKEKVFYVWFDAPIGYISITATYTEKWEQWWKNPKEVQLYQFMGKDNIPFHTVVFPASLIGGKTDWTMLHHVSTTEYLNYEGGKFSKSRGTGVFGVDCITSGIPSEVWRYYLLVNRPESSDSSFSWEDLYAKNNNELIANLGNFINRATTFTAKEFKGVVPQYELGEAEHKLVESVNQQIQSYVAALDKVFIKDALKVVMKISSIGNSYMQENKPWELIATDKGRCGTVVAVALNLARLLGTLLEPYMPAFQEKLLRQLNWKHQLIADTFTMDIPAGHKIGKPEILFKILDEKTVGKMRDKFGGQQQKSASEDSLPVDLRGAVVVGLDNHPQDEQLFLVKLDLGDQQRQAVARLKAHYKVEELLGKQVVVLCNLPVAEIKGSKSEGMILVAEGKKKTGEAPTKVLEPDSKVEKWAGATITAEGTSLAVKPNITLKEFQKLDIKLTKEGKVVFKQKFTLKTSGGVALTANGVEGPAKIK